jgi:hypothetical protein
MRATTDLTSPLVCAMMISLYVAVAGQPNMQRMDAGYRGAESGSDGLCSTIPSEGV